MATCILIGWKKKKKIRAANETQEKKTKTWKRSSFIFAAQSGKKNQVSRDIRLFFLWCESYTFAAGALGEGRTNTFSIGGVGFVEQRQLPALNILGDATKRGSKVVEESLLLLGLHDTEEVSGLGKVIISAARVEASRFTGKWEARLSFAEAKGLHSGSHHDVREVLGGPRVDDGHEAITLVVVDRATGLIHRQLLMVWAEAVELGIMIGENTTLEELVRGKTHARDEVGRREGRLLDLGVVVLDVAIELQDAHLVEGEVFVGPGLGGVKGAPAGALFPLNARGFAHELDGSRPPREVASSDGVEEVALGIVRILASDAVTFSRGEVFDALEGLKVPLDPGAFLAAVDEAESVDAEAIHMAKAVRNTAGRKEHGDVVEGLRGAGVKVPEGGGGRKVGLWVALVDVHHVGEIDGVLDEEHRGVVAHEVPVALFGVEAEGEPTGVTLGVGAAPLRGHE